MGVIIQQNTLPTIGISTYDKSPKYMYKSETNNYSNTFKNLHNQFNKPALFVETDHGNKSYGCTNNEQAVMVMNRLGTSGCTGFNIWRTFGSYAPELDELVRVSNFMNDAFVTHTFDAGNGAWEHQSSLWEVKVENELSGTKEKSNLRELQFVKSQDKSFGFGSLYNRQFNVQNVAEDVSQISVDNTDCYLGPGTETNGLKGYFFFDNWKPTYIKWNDKKKLKVVGLKNNTDYRIRYYDYNTYNLRGSSVQNSSGQGKLKIKHPKLAWEVQNNYQPIYNFTVEEVMGSKMLSQEDNSEDKGAVLETKLYPNPNNGLFTIEHTDLIKSIHISDMYGKTLFSKTYFDIGNALNFSLYLKPGVYFATVNNSVQIKFIVL